MQNEEQQNRPPQPTREERIARLMELSPREFWARADALKRALKKQIEFREKAKSQGSNKDLS